MERSSSTITIKKALGIFLLAAFVITAAGFAVGQLFFWNKHPVVDSADVDISLLEKAIAANPRNDKLLVELGWQYYKKGNYQKSISELNKALKLNKQNPAVHFNLGLVYQEVGTLTKAESEYRETLRLDQNSKYAYYALGKLYVSQGRYDEAIEHLKLATQKDSVSVDNYYLLGQAYEKKGFKPEAVAAYQKALTMVPDYQEAKTALNRLK